MNKKSISKCEEPSCMCNCHEEIDYRKYWERPNKELLSEVLDKTIDLDYLILRINNFSSIFRK